MNELDKNSVSKQPLVSVLVGVYQQVNVVEETLRSIISQTYSNLEIIVSDDCSTDGSRELLAEFAKTDPRIRLFLQEKNLGNAGNYNFLAAAATGKYVSVFAGDDVMCKDKIETQIAQLEKNPHASFCHHAVFDLDAATRKVRGVISQHYESGVTTIHDVLRHLGIPGSMSIIYRTDMVSDPVFDSELRYVCDWMQIIRLTMLGTGIYIDKPLCYYRRDAIYNGKDPSQYEDEFLRTIEITRADYALPGNEVDESCDLAAARYFLGAGYRRMMRGENVKAREMFMKKKPTLKLSLLGYILAAISFFPLNGRFLIGIKNMYRTIR